MVEYNNPDQHFAQQRATQAAEKLAAASEAQYKGGAENRSTNEKFYNNLALFSSGTVALSVTFLGYLKSLPKAVQHPHLLVACWICLMTCAASSLFWSFVYGYYSHYFHEWQTANAQKEKYEADAKEFPTLARGTVSVQTRSTTSRQEIADFVSNRTEAAAICAKRATSAKRWETFYMHFWRWLGRMAHASFLGGLVLLLAFAIRNM
jgi:hypothetical protein